MDVLARNSVREAELGLLIEACGPLETPPGKLDGLSQKNSSSGLTLALKMMRALRGQMLSNVVNRQQEEKDDMSEENRKQENTFKHVGHSRAS